MIINSIGPSSCTPFWDPITERHDPGRGRRTAAISLSLSHHYVLEKKSREKCEHDQVTTNIFKLVVYISLSYMIYRRWSEKAIMIPILKINKLKCFFLSVNWVSQGHTVRCGPRHILSSCFMCLSHKQKQTELSLVVSAFHASILKIAEPSHSCEAWIQIIVLYNSIDGQLLALIQ